MQRRNPSATMALLQKANSQLKGEKVTKPEDELNDYISSLTQKTSKQQKLVNFEDLGDSISISSDIEDSPIKQAAAPTPSSGSKFLKKKPSVEDKGDTPDNVSKFLKKPQLSTGSPSPSVQQQQQRYGSAPGRMVGTGQSGGKAGLRGSGSSALDKASALTGKIQQRVATQKTFTLESDSDESFSAVKLARSSGEQISESQSDSVKIGRDKGKFLKKTVTPSSTPAPSLEPPQTSIKQSNKAKTSSKGPVESTQNKKASPFQLKSSLKYSTDVVLTSEEESLAEFVGGLPSSSDSLDKPKQRYGRSGRHTPSPPPNKFVKARRSPSPPPPNRSKSPAKGQGRSVSPQNKPPMLRRTPSPSPRNASPGLRRRSPSPKLMRSYSDDSNVAESIKDEIAEDYNLGFNVIMDLEDLGPSVEEELPQVNETSRSDSPVRSTARKSTREDKKKSKKSSKSGTSSKERKDSSSPFKAKQDSESPFRAKSSDKAESVFKAKSGKSDSPFKSSDGGNNSPFKAKGGDKGSPFKSSTGGNQSPFHGGQTESPFKSKSAGSPFRASNEGSVFKSSEQTKEKASQKKSKSKVAKKDKKGRKSDRSEKSVSSSKGRKKQTNNLFSSFGIQSVDDLFDHSVKVSEYDSIKSEVDEVRSEVSEEIKTEKPGAYSYSQRFEDSATEIPTEADVTKPSNGYTEDFESISERVGYRSDTGRSSMSEVRTKYSGDETVASYTEFSDESETRSYISESIYTDDDNDDRTYSESYSENSEDFTKSMVPTRSSRSEMTPLPPHGMISAEVQTHIDGLLYSWNPAGVGMSIPSTPYGLHFVDPTPIATQTVSADALEAMTSYSPSMLALHDMLKSQLELTKEFLDVQKRMYANFSNDIKPGFKYTTLEDTKKYIKKNRKKKLTFKEALQLVDLETIRS
ncbi:hypothetical protein ACF0H5_011068 [Mactra antiquata]